MGLPNKTLELIDRVERGDREAALDLVELYKPENIDDLVLFVAPEHPRARRSSTPWRTPSTHTWPRLTERRFDLGVLAAMAGIAWFGLKRAR